MPTQTLSPPPHHIPPAKREHHSTLKRLALSASQVNHSAGPTQLSLCVMITEGVWPYAAMQSRWGYMASQCRHDIVVNCTATFQAVLRLYAAQQCSTLTGRQQLPRPACGKAHKCNSTCFKLPSTAIRQQLLLVLNMTHGG